MFRPVGSQPPSVYWRRRIIVLGSVVLLIVLLILTVRAVTSGNNDKPVGQGGTSSTAGTSTPPPAPRTTPSSQHPSSTHGSTGKHSPTPSRTTSAAPPPRCKAKDLAVTAVVGKSSYRVGDHPVVELQVTNTGAKSCIQDLADSQVVLRVYNGESRVWGSHDCEIKSGTDDRMLAVNRPVRVSITWSGLTSQPKCAGTRQRVGAGTYTLYAVLSGKTGKATQFSIS